jgi:hypothetical protein
LSSVSVDPRIIRFKISPHDDLRGEADGDWDIQRRFPLAGAVKHRAIRQRYSDGLPWEETDLFADTYRKRFESGETVRGEATLEGLLEQYRTRVDGMFDDLKRNGFREGHPLPKLLIGRDGEIFIGNQGNHRLAMAQVLGLPRIAGEVICRHKLAGERACTLHHLALPAHVQRISKPCGN